MFRGVPMADQYITTLTALASAVVGGAVALLAVFLTNRSNTARLVLQLDHESRQRKADLLRDRGEELYELTDKWLRKFAGYYLRRPFVLCQQSIEKGGESFKLQVLECIRAV